MPRAVKRSSFVTVVWLTCQLLALAAPLVVNGGSVPVDEEVCTCPGGNAGAACPMHHRKDESRPASGFRNSCASPDVALLGMAGGLGILPQPAVLGVDVPAASVILVPDLRSGRIASPDSPPPRA